MDLDHGNEIIILTTFKAFPNFEAARADTLNKLVVNLQ